MLVLSRKKDESVVINNDIRIVVVEIRGDKVRLGVEAPKEVPVHRSEVYEAINNGGSEVEVTDSFLPLKQSDERLDGGRVGLAGGTHAVPGDPSHPPEPGAVRE